MAETNGNGRQGNLEGLYRHPETGAEVVTQHDGKIGSAQSDAVVQVGFKYVGPTPKTETKVAPEAKTTK